LAAEAVGDATAPLVIVERLLATVDARLQTRITTGYSTAPEVLARGDGDCKDHTVLFLALARAAGLPARPVQGLVFANDTEPPSFGGHIWAGRSEERRAGKQRSSRAEDRVKANHGTVIL